MSSIKSTRVRMSYSLGSDIARITFFNVGYLIKMTDKWKAKKNGWMINPIIDMHP